MKRKTMSILLVAILAFSMMFSMTAFADESGSTVSSTEKWLGEIAQDKISSLNIDIAINSIDLVTDFAGNEYGVIDCVPKGYFIYHVESGTCVEYNLNARSPYLHTTGKPVYGGPSYYYEYNGQTYSHTVLDEQLTQSSALRMADANIQYNNKLNKTPDVRVKSYIDGESSSNVYNYYRSGTEEKWVPDKEFFTSKKSNFGYIDGNYCGYIAANLVLSYWNDQNKITLASGYVSNPVTLTNALTALGSSNLTYPWDIASVINSFCNANSISGEAKWALLSADISHHISNGRPVILFGNYALSDNHAIVAYGYNTYETFTGYTYICHFGWNEKNGNSYESVHVHGDESTIGGSTVFIP